MQRIALFLPPKGRIQGVGYNPGAAVLDKNRSPGILLPSEMPRT
jgi:hypothetical protein